jgi:hypothetical protein
MQFGLVCLARHEIFFLPTPARSLASHLAARFRWDDTFDWLSSTSSRKTPLFVSSTSLGKTVSSGTTDIAFSLFSSLDDDSFCRRLNNHSFSTSDSDCCLFSLVLNVVLQQLGDLVTLLSNLHWASNFPIIPPIGGAMNPK